MHPRYVDDRFSSKMPDGRSVLRYSSDLRVALSRLAGGEGPSRKEVDAAPTISLWFVQRVIPEDRDDEPFFRLVGRFAGHPYIGEGRLAHTSPLLGLDHDLRWAWCRSRVYRLIDPLHVALKRGYT